jgi:acetolactate synthase-1/2/3 large subunit
MLDLTNPALDWCRLGEGMGVPSTRVATAEELRAALAEAMAQNGPRLIEAML